MRRIWRGFTRIIVVAVMLLSMVVTDYDTVDAAETAVIGNSPAWIASLPQAATAKQMLVVANIQGTLSWVTLNEKDADGIWRMKVNTLAFTGKNGMGKVKEGDKKTPVGTYRFTNAFGIAPDPGCKMPYLQVSNDIYWSGDHNPGMHYNELVNIKAYPNLDTKNSEHIIEYTTEYQYCLNISYNEEGDPTRGSALFLHCLSAHKTYTGGCVAIPQDQMITVMQNVDSDCVVVIDTLENLGGSL